MLYKLVLTFESVDALLKWNHSMKATEQCFPVVLFIMLYKVVLPFESVKCDYSDESCQAADLCSGAFHFSIVSVVK